MRSRSTQTRNEGNKKGKGELGTVKEECKVRQEEMTKTVIGMGEKLKEEIGSTKQRVDKVAKGLEGYCASVDAMM